MRWRAPIAAALLLAAQAAAADDGAELAALVDEGIDAVLAEQGVAPTPPCDDETFLRRATLDATGTLPSGEQVVAFLADPARDKRARLVERLLSSRAHARHLAEQTTELLLDRLNGVEGQVAYYRASFKGWLEEAFFEDRPWDQIAAELLAGEGNTSEKAQLLYLFDRGMSGPEDLTGAAARQFLGLQLECARCHDHPFDESTQAQFHGLAAFFSRLRVRQTPGMRGRFEIGEAPLGEHRFTFADGKRREVPPASLTAALPSGVAPAGITRTSRRAAFTRWLTSPRNPWFARAVVNRTWARLFGRGLVEPVDDLSGAADSIHAPLLLRLAAAFASGGHSLRQLYRGLLSSRAYQRRSSGDPKALAAARPLFGAAHVRPLAAPVVASILLRAAGRDTPREGELPRLHSALVDRIVSELRRALPAPRAGEVPDADRVTTAEGVFFLNGKAPNGLVRGPALRALVRSDPAPASRVRSLFLRTLSRPPRPEEQRAALAHLKRRGDGQDAYEDLFWALLATSEFVTNH